MSAIQVSAQEMSILYASAYCAYAACDILVILVYDWVLCLGQEIRFIWTWQSKVTGSSLLYAFSRYAILVKVILVVATTSPMSDQMSRYAHICSLNDSCKAVVWTQIVTEILGGIAFSAFSALRAYALSNRSTWLAAIIFLWVLPPAAMLILLERVISGPLHQLMGELLVVGITWWYTYQSYRIRKGIDLGRTGHSFLASLYILAIIFNTAPVSAAVVTASSYLLLFFDPITSIITCRFMLSLRQFDNSVADGTTSGPGDRAQQRTGLGDLLQFAAHPTDSLPSFIASFAYPVHVESVLSETDSDGLADGGSEWQEMDALAPTQNLDDAIASELSP
ncbi:hypothetical protein V8D89_001211 [Ganoderma adspersum]